jgi:hypothetical protein
LNKHLLIDYVVKFRQPIASSKTAETELISRNKYISDVKMFIQSFESIWPTPAAAYAALKKPFADNFAYRHVSKRVETFIADCSDMDTLLRCTVRYQDDISNGIVFPKITTTAAGAAPPAAGAPAATTAATAGSHKPEGRKAHAAQKKLLKDTICLNPTCNRTADHITYKCDIPCAIPTCPTPTLPHPASACMLLRIKDLYVPYFKSCEVCSSTTCLLLLAFALQFLNLGTLKHHGVLFLQSNSIPEQMCLSLLFLFRMLPYTHVLRLFMLPPALQLPLLALPL